MTTSRIITTNQPGIHRQLEQYVRRHLSSRFQRPFPDYSLKVFAQAQQLVAQHTGNLILDSYCGVGESTVKLAKQYPQALVIGIDKSSYRLAKHDVQYRCANITNYHIFQADVDDFWRLALQAGWRVAKHCLFYPNPWPKSSHLKRRIHGSPLFPTLLALSDHIELRSNWRLYVEEFSTALTIAGYSANIARHDAKQAMTPFERKYRDSGQALWQCTSQLNNQPTEPGNIQ